MPVIELQPMPEMRLMPSIGQDRRGQHRVGSRLTDINEDKVFVAGEAIDKRDALGYTGEIQETTADVLALGATFIDSGNATVNQDGAGDITMRDASGGDEKHGLINWSGAPTKPSATGLTLLKFEVRIQGRMFSGNTNQTITIQHLSSSFDETTVTWDTTPTFAGSIATIDFDASAFDTGFFEVTEAEYDNIKANGIGMDYAADNGATAVWGDEDDGTPPKLDVRFTYKITDGKIYKVKATTAEYANSFVGMATEGAIKDKRLNVRIAGSMPKFSGMTAQGKQYLSDTAGAISNSAGTVTKIIGKAKTTTDLQIQSAIT